MPIFWSPSSQTALAESELEYNENHLSTSIYLKFPLANTINDQPISALIWTTTPWTLPANRAICFNPELDYVTIQFEGEDEVYLVAKDCIERLETALGKKLNPDFYSVSVENLHLLKYSHPLAPFLPPSSPAIDRLPFLSSNHVTTAKGSGLVHAAPAHGHEDYHAFRAHGLRVDELPAIDRDGVFTEGAGDTLRGLNVLGNG